MATIDTNMSLVMIDPNEPLELYDGTIIKGRLEWFLYALCCLDYGNLPTPLSRIEEWANALITNELPNMEPQSRAEEFFKAILTGDTSNLPTPQSRSEVLLDKLARGENDFTNVEKIQSRYEFLLAYLIKNGGGIGNIDYVLYKFQKEDETLYNTKERPVKSAILSGQTLVNLFNPNDITTPNTDMYMENGYIILPVKNHRYNHLRIPKEKCQMFEPGEKYTLWVHMLENVTEDNDGETRQGSSFFLQTYDYSDSIVKTSNQGVYGCRFDNNEVGTKMCVFEMHDKETMETKRDGLNFDLQCYYAKTGGIQKLAIVILKGDWSNKELPFDKPFYGMQSVKMPVLTTTGKNLFNSTFIRGNRLNETGAINQQMSYMTTADYINIKNVDSAMASIGDGYRISQFFLYDDNGNFISRNGNPLTNTANATKCHITIAKNPATEVTDEDLSEVLKTFQLEQGSVATSFEPFKSNILTVNEDVTLRGIGEVQDTLDCLTGEVTERIGEMILDGSEDWSGWFGSVNELTYGAILTIDGKGEGVFANDRLIDSKVLFGIDEVGIWNVADSRIVIRVNKIEGVDSVSAVKSFLKNEPITIQYQLATPTIKTVDLTITDQGGATIPKLNTFDKITHVNVSATDILPEVEMEVATTVGEDLSGTLYSTMEDIETKQEALKESNNAQTESINSTMMATTEIYESLL